MSPETLFDVRPSATPAFASPAPQRIPGNAAVPNYCIFRAGDDYFGVPLAEVEEVLARPEITEVPASPPFLLGTISRQDETLPVIDLAMCAAALPDPQLCVVVRVPSGASEISIALAADELICPVPACSVEMQFTIFEAASRFIAGRLSYGGKVAWALDPTRLTNALFSSKLD